MKPKTIIITILAITIVGFAISAINSGQAAANGDGSSIIQTDIDSSFTYQGQLMDDGVPMIGSCDLRFSLWDAASGGNQMGSSQTKTNVALNNGRFTLTLNDNNQFGADAFVGAARWLKVEVRCPAGGGSYTALSPRQPLTGAPSAQTLRPGAVIRGNVLGNGGDEAMLKLESDNVGLRVESDGTAVYVDDALRGMFINHALLNGIHMGTVGNPSSQQAPFGSENGIVIEGAENNGLFIGHADATGVFVNSAGGTGVFVNETGSFGILVEDAGSDGVAVAGAAGHGMYVESASNGAFVSRAGYPSSQISPPASGHGFVIAGAEGNGLSVGRADADGVYVASAGDAGLLVNSADLDGVRVYSAGDAGMEVYSAVGDGISIDSVGSNGLEVSLAGNYGVFVYSAGFDGAYVTLAGNPSSSEAPLDSGNGFVIAGAERDGLFVGHADRIGVGVNEANGDAVWANTTDAAGEWGIYTPDKVFAGATTANAMSIIAQVADGGALMAGDVAEVAGLAEMTAENGLQMVSVHRAGTTPGAGLVGVVTGRMALTPLSPDDPTLEWRSADGPAQPGDHVSITVLGVAEVKVKPDAVIQSGQRLTVDTTTGLARPLQTVQVDGFELTEGTAVIGIALAAPQPGKDTIPVFVTLR